MQSFVIGLVSVALLAIGASSAQAAISSVHSFEDAYGDGTPGVLVGNSLSGLNIGILADIPGRLAEGGWRVGLYIDDRASHMAASTEPTGSSTGALRSASWLLGCSAPST